ncbi:unnamed protein product [Lampetra fluviatilis]
MATFKKVGIDQRGRRGGRCSFVHWQRPCETFDLITERGIVRRLRFESIPLILPAEWMGTALMPSSLARLTVQGSALGALTQRGVSARRLLRDSCVWGSWDAPGAVIHPEEVKPQIDGSSNVVIGPPSQGFEALEHEKVQRGGEANSTNY